ncbi:hypothetical protein, conserved [Cyanidioschyzon merolae strain 10D]|uniref:Uncharacterized protein n=1 Tax=Cyanidioschyzon merolae (strain NIES-3377 / 10D) TaxID=280699 RepID=M1VBY1_CYAM1|nr:hypothetical protein, conserved [Cyanidioschyzon merolae strain 10D]BAM79932.1 hypothetical protein, conserved [Cyanidioschyzon merolae strain 10D]|eukprot:XP_005536218.1 hypothetical protein, conserved [Cyanidioschyzon merolae strain 10D]
MSARANASVSGLLREAKEALRDKRYAYALECARQVLQQDRGNYFAYVFVGAAAAGLGERERSLQAYQRATALRPTDLLAWRGLCESAAEATGTESTAYWRAVLEACDRCIEAEPTATDEQRLEQLLVRRQRALDVLCGRTPSDHAFNELDCERLQARFEVEHREPDALEWLHMAGYLKSSTTGGLVALWRWFQRAATRAWREHPVRFDAYLRAAMSMWTYAGDPHALLDSWINGAASGDVVCTSVLEALLFNDTAPQSLVNSWREWCQRTVHRVPYSAHTNELARVLLFVIAIRCRNDDSRSTAARSSTEDLAIDNFRGKTPLTQALLQLGVGMHRREWHVVARAAGRAVQHLRELQSEQRHLSVLLASLHLAVGIAKHALGHPQEAQDAFQMALEVLHTEAFTGDAVLWSTRLRCAAWRLLAVELWQHNDVRSRQRALSLCEQVLAADPNDLWAQVHRIEWHDEQARSEASLGRSYAGDRCVDWERHWSVLQNLRVEADDHEPTPMPLGLVLLGWGRDVASTSRLRALALQSRARHRRLRHQRKQSAPVECDASSRAADAIPDLLAAIAIDPCFGAPYLELARVLWESALALGWPSGAGERALVLDTPAPEMDHAIWKASGSANPTAAASLAAVRAGASGCGALSGAVPFARPSVSVSLLPHDVQVPVTDSSAAHQTSTTASMNASGTPNEADAARLRQRSEPSATKRPGTLSPSSSTLDNATRSAEPQDRRTGPGEAQGSAASAEHPLPGNEPLSQEHASVTEQVNRGDARERSQKARRYWQLALHCLERAHALEPSDETAALRLVQAYSWLLHEQVQRMDSSAVWNAVQRMEQVCLTTIAAHSRTLPWAWFTLGWLQFERQDWSACSVSLQKYLQTEDVSAFRDRRRLLAWYALGEAYQQQGKIVAAAEALSRSWSFRDHLMRSSSSDALQLMTLVGTAYASLLAAEGRHTEALSLVGELERLLLERNAGGASHESERAAHARYTEAPEVPGAAASAVETEIWSGIAGQRACLDGTRGTVDSAARAGAETAAVAPAATAHAAVALPTAPIVSTSDNAQPSTATVQGQPDGTGTRNMQASLCMLDALLYSSLARIQDSFAELQWTLGCQRAAQHNWHMAMEALERANRALPSGAGTAALESRFVQIVMKVLRRLGPAALTALCSSSCSAGEEAASRSRSSATLVVTEASVPSLRRIREVLQRILDRSGGARAQPILFAMLQLLALLECVRSDDGAQDGLESGVRQALETLINTLQGAGPKARGPLAGLLLVSLAFTGCICYHDVERWSLLSRLGRLDIDTAVVVVALALLNEVRCPEAALASADERQIATDSASLGHDSSTALERGLEWLYAHHTDSRLGTTLMAMVYERLLGDLNSADRFSELSVLADPTEALAQLRAIPAFLRRSCSATEALSAADWIRHAFYWRRVQQHGLLWPPPQPMMRITTPLAAEMKQQAFCEVAAQLDAYWSENIARLAGERRQHALAVGIEIEAASEGDESPEAYLDWIHRYPDLAEVRPFAWGPQQPPQ